MRVVLDPNVLISGLLTPRGSPAKVLSAWLEGAYELVVSPKVLAELERALAYPKLRARISDREAGEFVELLRRGADAHDDPDDPPALRSPDPGDDYLIALAHSVSAVIVSGDKHLLGLSNRLPVYSPAAFLKMLADAL
ncbi:MAG: putative toxin-antitoxin system toxin component, PIN family [Actinobacteria bacterium]|nr:putative toxin-antitoxin system toxin component, PIN family [Actinomycetota bacterium]